MTRHKGSSSQETLYTRNKPWCCRSIHRYLNPLSLHPSIHPLIHPRPSSHSPIHSPTHLSIPPFHSPIPIHPSTIMQITRPPVTLSNPEQPRPCMQGVLLKSDGYTYLQTHQLTCTRTYLCDIPANTPVLRMAASEWVTTSLPNLSEDKHLHRNDFWWTVQTTACLLPALLAAADHDYHRRLRPSGRTGRGQPGGPAGYRERVALLLVINCYKLVPWRLVLRKGPVCWFGRWHSTIARTERRL